MFSLQTTVILKFNQIAKLTLPLFFLFLMVITLKYYTKEVLNNKDQSQNHVKHLYVMTQNTD